MFCRRVLLGCIILFCTGTVVWALRPDEKAGANPAFNHAASGRAPSPRQLEHALAGRAAGVSVRWCSRRGTPFRVRGKGLGSRKGFSAGFRRPAMGPNDALSVLDNVAGMFRMRDASEEFSVARTWQDKLGLTHVRSRQLHRGLRVVGGTLTVHFDRAGEACEIGGCYIPDIRLSIHPALSAQEAIDAMNRHLAARGKQKGTIVSGPELVVFALEKEPVLAYEIESASADQGRFERWRFWVDAVSGNICLAYNDVEAVSAPSSGTNAVITGSILTGEGGGVASVTGWGEDTGNYYLYNSTSNWIIYNVSSSLVYSDYSTYAYRTSNNWGSSDRVEMSAAVNFGFIQDYFLNVHGRNSFDDAGTLMWVVVHEGNNYVNASYDLGTCYFGDGDGIEANSLVVLDVAAHEYTHGVTDYSADLIYYGESGALNESFSDVFGACVEFHAQPDDRASYPAAAPGKADWLLSEDAWISPAALRDMRAPANTATVGAGNEQPSRYLGTYWYFGTGDNGGVHYNSGVQNFFFYLLVEGGTGVNDGLAYSVTGLGVTNAEQVAYRALTIYCDPYTDHPAAREAWISAAADLNPAWVTNVQAAWDAVGVFERAAPPLALPDAGVYASPISVTASVATAGAQIRYTLNGTEPTAGSALYTAPLSVSNDVTITFKAFKAGMDSSLPTVYQYAFGDIIAAFPFDTDPGWGVEGLWAFGVPAGHGGEYGGRDPWAGYTGTNVYGYNLSGDYANDMAVSERLTSSAIDCSDYADVRLCFRRWLNVEDRTYDQATIQVSSGAGWSDVWVNPTGNSLEDYAWEFVRHDVSSQADGAGSVQFRWAMGPTDVGWRFSGWNLDDVIVVGHRIPSNVTVVSAVPTNESVRLSWMLPADPNTVGVHVRRKAASPPVSVADGVQAYLGTGTNLVDSGLANGVTYYYRLCSYDAHGNYSDGVVTNATPYDTEPPGPISNFLAVAGSDYIDLSWINPADGDLVGIWIQRSAVAYPTNRTDGTNVFNGAGTGFRDSGLVHGQPYYYRAWAYDGVPFYSTPASVTQSPNDVTDPNVAIQVPTAGTSWLSATNALTIGGAASDDAGLARVTVANNRDVAGFVCSGTTNWSFAGLPLYSGWNYITVTAEDMAGNTRVDTLAINYTGDARYSDVLFSGALVQRIDFDDPVTAGDTVVVQWDVLSYVPLRGRLGTGSSAGGWYLFKNARFMGAAASSWNLAGRNAVVYTFECDYVVPTNTGDFSVWFSHAQMDGASYMSAVVPDGVDARPDPVQSKLITRTILAGVDNAPVTEAAYYDAVHPFESTAQSLMRSGGTVIEIDVPTSTNSWTAGKNITCEWTVLSYVDVFAKMSIVSLADSRVILSVPGTLIATRNSSWSLKGVYAKERTFRAAFTVPNDPGVRELYFLNAQKGVTGSSWMAGNIPAGVDPSPVFFNGMYGRFIERELVGP